jgi:hypothetical protein
MQSLFPGGHNSPSKSIIKCSFGLLGRVRTVGARHPCLALIDIIQRKDYQTCGITGSIVVHTWRKNMNKYVLLGVIALVTLLAVPMVSALGNDVPVYVNGNIPDKLTLSIDKDCSFADMSVGTHESDMATATVETTVKYNVAVDGSSGHSRYMEETTSGTPLTEPIKLWTGSAYFVLPHSSWMSGDTTGTFTKDIYFSQEVKNTDLAGTYRAWVTFTATAV